MTADFRRVTADFSVAPQLTAEDIARVAAAGFKVLINNRPDGEAPGQMTNAEAQQAAEALGLFYHALPFAGPPPPAVVAETEALLAAAPGPVLAYCRTGTRCITAWALAQALGGVRTPDEIIARAAEAGYDLSGARVALEGLYPG
ncbi:MAG: TIGR01244 family sulfur transferase [Pseudomonadota bacterium]